MAKLFAHWMIVNYREAYNMFTCSGILFNHESPLRGLEFITRKLTYGIARIKHGLQDKIVVGNLDAKRDWGYADEYIQGMWLMLQQEQADDYILATGETHTVREFVEYAFDSVGFKIRWEGQDVLTKGIDEKTGKVLIEVSPEFYRPAEVELLLGNPAKAKERLGWQPVVKFEELVRMMTEADIRRVIEEKR